MDACRATTKKGIACKKTRMVGSDYCVVHSQKGNINEDKLEDKRKNETIECPVCLDGEEVEKLFRFSCGHFIHLSCAKNLVKSECPICRTEIKDIPADIAQNIEKNKKQYRQELEHEAEQEFRRILETEGTQFIIEIPPVEFEIACALRILREQGIPCLYIPTKVSIVMPKSSPRPPLGLIFWRIIKSVFARVCEDVLDVDDGNSDEEFPDEKEQNDDPFDNNVSRVIEIEREEADE